MTETGVLPESHKQRSTVCGIRNQAGDDLAAQESMVVGTKYVFERRRRRDLRPNVPDSIAALPERCAGSTGSRSQQGSRTPPVNGIADLVCVVQGHGQRFLDQEVLPGLGHGDGVGGGRNPGWRRSQRRDRMLEQIGVATTGRAYRGAGLPPQPSAEVRQADDRTPAPVSASAYSRPRRSRADNPKGYHAKSLQNMDC